MQRTVIIKRSHSTNSITEEFATGDGFGKAIQQEGPTVQV